MESACLYSVRHRVVSLLHAATGRAAGKRSIHCQEYVEVLGAVGSGQRNRSRLDELLTARTFSLGDNLMNFNLALSVPLLLGFVLLQQTVPPPNQAQEKIGYKSDAKADQNKTLLLKDFHPGSMLHAPEHQIDRAKFYVIDVHNHQNDAMGIDDHMAPARVVEIMDK